MRRIVSLSLVTTGLALSLLCQDARATPPFLYSGQSLAREARGRPWHQPYYYPQWGRPVALVVPPVAGLHTEYSWGVTMNGMRPVYHQFSRAVPGVSSSEGGGQAPQPPPYSPASTRQFGVYYIRAPW